MARVLTDLDREYWSAQVQETLFVENTALYLAGGEAQSHLSADGKKFHKPILSKPSAGTYTPYADIDFSQKSASDQELSVDQMEYVAEEVDDTDKKQNWYDALGHAAMSMQKVLNNRIEQFYLGKMTGSNHTVDDGSVGGVSGNNIVFSGTNASEVFTAAHTKLDVVDAPMPGRVAVLGAHNLGVLRQMLSSRETSLGDSVLANGRVVGNLEGWEIVYNNNLPWSATLTINGITGPANGDTVTIAGVTFEFQDVLTNAATGNYGVLTDATAPTARTNLSNAIAQSGGTVGTDYEALSAEDKFILTEKRRVAATTAEAMAFTGYGDIVVSANAATPAEVAWSAQKQTSLFAVRGAIDLVVQLGKTLETTRKQAGFADLIKGLSLYGAKMFDDGAMLSCKVDFDASNWA
ncbi:MAG: hypothetical protein PF549_01340 [Patescibacteria group bacterium]|jgi:hypothetical protein|nr:hypothetical protein [Patescibacteria group bacterium]